MLVAGVKIGRTAQNNVSDVYIPIVLKPAREPDWVIGNGTAESCTEAALLAATTVDGYVTFDCGTNKTEILLSQPIQIENDLELDGKGQIVLDGDGRSSLLTITSGSAASLQNMTIQNSGNASESAVTVGAGSTVVFDGITFANNRVVVNRSYCGGGGAITIEENSNVTIINSLFRDNNAVNGGAIHSRDSILEIRGSQFVRNQAAQATRSQQTIWEQLQATRDTASRVPLGVCAGGGAIYADGVGSRLSIEDSQFVENSSNQHGGALFLALRNNDQVTIKNTTFDNNIARLSSEWSGTGGALWLGESQSGQSGMSVTISESSFVGNSAEFQGGAIYNRIPLRIENSTLAENIARHPTLTDLSMWQRGSGGALRIDINARTMLDNVTIARNTAGYQGGGISGSGAIARNTLIADNHAEWAHNRYHNCTNSVENWGHNIQFLSSLAEQDHLAASSCGDGLWQRNPMLGVLGMHNGTTRSIALLGGSEAIDAGNSATCTSHDQRRLARTYGTACDIGAYESAETQPPTTSPTPTNTLTPTPTTTPIATITPTSTPPPNGNNVVGNGVASSCTETAFAEVLAQGGDVTFDCGAGEVTIPLTQRHIMQLDTTIDGGDKITLDGQHSTALLGSEERLTIGLYNLKLINGHSHEEGAGVNVGYWNDLQVENVTFSQNVSVADHKVCDGGGALFIGGGGQATITGATFKNNSAMNGGAINNLRTKLTILDSHFEENTALHTATFNQLGDCGGGGALYFDGTRKPEDGGADEVILKNLTFINNTTNNVGGAIFLAVRTDERIRFENVLFAGNRAIQGDASFDTAKGGALWIGQGVGGQTGYDIDLTNVSFVDNHSEFQGGALWTRSPVTLSNVTFFGNSAIDHRVTDPDNWRAGIGGAITAADQAQVTLKHATIVSNTAGFVGGGINGENFTLMNTLIANNKGFWWRALQQNCTHHPQNWGGNLQFQAEVPEEQQGWKSNCGDTIPILNPRIGPPETINPYVTVLPLQADSAAIGIGQMQHCTTTDQRGVPRPQGEACDSGAYEYTPAARATIRE